MYYESNVRCFGLFFHVLRIKGLVMLFVFMIRHVVTLRNLYRYKLGKIIMTEIFIDISYGK